MAVRWVKSSDVRDWHAALGEGASILSIARSSGRSPHTVHRHVDDPVKILRRRAERLESLFASCNRALAEART